MTGQDTDRGSKTVVGSHTQVHIIGVEVAHVVVATHGRSAYIALCGLGCFADAMTTRLDRMMHVTRKPSNKQRVCADLTVSVQDVQACITRHLRDRSTTDLWSCIVPGPDGPRTWSFKSRPDGRWMARFSSLAFDLVCDVCKNTKILSRVLVAALQACVLAGVVKNASGSEETKFIASVDVTVRILLSWLRQLKVSKKIRDAALKRVSEAEKAKVSAVMEKIELNSDEAEAAAKESEDGSESDVDMTFLVSIDSLCLPSSTTGKTKEGAQGLPNFFNNRHRMYDKEIWSQCTPLFYPTRGYHAVLVGSNTGEVPGMPVEFHGHVDEILRYAQSAHASSQLRSWHTVERTFKI